MTVIITITGYFLIMNIIGFASMGLDKWKAIHHTWRISERTLFAIALLGGSLGSTIGMYTFRHKTKHIYFLYGFPIILAIQIILIAYMIGSGNITIM